MNFASARATGRNNETYEWKNTQHRKFLANSLKEEQNESDNDEDYDDELNDLRKISKFNFSGLSFKDYVSNIDTELNNEMSTLVSLFIK